MYQDDKKKETMDIYIVQPRDDINSIADKFGVSVSTLILENGIENQESLVPGQALVITYPSQIHTVEEGDSLTSIASNYDVSVMQLLRNNSFLSDREYIFPGESLVISYDTDRKLAIAGYIYPFVNMKTLEKTLPYLTYLYVINYRIADGGNIITLNDTSEIINLSLSYSTIPLMGLSAVSPRGERDIEEIFELLVNKNYQTQFINNILEIIQVSGYYGVNFFVSELSESNQELYFELLKNLSDSLGNKGYLMFFTVDPNIEFIDGEVSFQNIDYTMAGKLIDGVTFINELWASIKGPPSPIASVSLLSDYMDIIIPIVSEDKIYAEIPLLAYDWRLPYIDQNTFANSLSLNFAMSLAIDVGAVIQFDEVSQTPFFQYKNIYSPYLPDHIVWFVDARTFDAMLQLVTEKNMAGVGVWNIMTFYQQLWSVLISQYDVIKLLP